MAPAQNREFKSTLEYSDITHAYLWDQEDYAYVKKIYDIIKFFDKHGEYSEKRAEISRFENLLKRARHDQTSYDTLADRRVEPILSRKKIE